MDTEPYKKSDYLWPIVIFCFILFAVFVGLIVWLSRDSNDETVQNEQTEEITEQTSESQEATTTTQVDSLVTYTVPDGWYTRTCEGDNSTVYFVSSNTVPDCSADPNYSMSFTIDPQGRTDCSQLQNVQNVSKHSCKSIFIDDRKTLQTETVYTEESDFLPKRTLLAYFMDTGNGVVLANYIYRDEPKDATGFESLVQSIRVKN